MAKILPFRAVRPTRDLVSIMVSRSYDSYTPSERKWRMKRNPFSFLHILNPGFKYHKKLSGKERFSLVRNRYMEFKEDGYLVQDSAPQYYVYQIINREQQVFRGIVAAASVEDYENNIIKKHEDTISDREKLFTEYLYTVGFNAEAVLLTYPEDDILEEVMDEVVKDRAEYEFTTTYRDTHYVWPVAHKATVNRIQAAFKAIPAVYIADGHHRTASSVGLAKLVKELGQDSKSIQEASQYFMSYLIPETDLKIYAFKRLVKDLNGLSKEAFLVALDAIYRIENRGITYYHPSRKHHFGMYIDGEYYSLYLRKSYREFSNALEELDPFILLKTVLEPILGIKDPRNDARLNYSTEREGACGIKEAVDSGDFTVGFSMIPVSITEMKAVADQGLTMPPKSTFILPKLRTGVTIYEF